MRKDVRFLASVLSHNDAESAIALLDSLTTQSYPAAEILIVDNASRPEHFDRVTTGHPGASAIRNSSNLGYTGGNNVALQHALDGGFDYALLFNQDVILPQDFIERMRDAVLEEPDGAVFGAVEKDHTGAVRTAYGDMPCPVTFASRWRRSLPEGNGASLPVPSVQGAAICIGRGAIVAGLRFDPALFLYCEEMDIACQAKAMGKRIFLAPACEIRHKSSHPRFSLMQGYYIQRNRLYLSFKHGSALARLTSPLYHLLIELPLKSLVRLMQGKLKYTLACWAGFWDALRGEMYEGRGLDR